MLMVILALLGFAGLYFAMRLVRAVIAQKMWPKVEAVVVGAATNFLDTLGIGSLAPTMAWLRLRRLVPDSMIPPTMLAGHTLPTVAQAVIFLVLLGVFVDPVLLVSCGVALFVGAILGAPLVSRASVSLVQSIVGAALILAALLYAMSNLHVMPAGGSAAALSPLWTAVAIFANLVFGVLLNFGVGNYSPSLVMFSLMGMDPKFAFPIMAGGAALAATAASSRHVAIGDIDLRIAAGLALGGIPAVLVAAFVVKSMPVELLRWLVVVVVVYTAVIMLRAAIVGRRVELRALSRVAGSWGET
jgi:uncharacterized membrane protein YfcA